jgi:hypothetical protein
MSNPSTARRFSFAILALFATVTMQSLWLGALDHDAALTLAAIPV